MPTSKRLPFNEGELVRYNARRFVVRWIRWPGPLDGGNHVPGSVIMSLGAARKDGKMDLRGGTMTGAFNPKDFERLRANGQLRVVK